MGDFFKSAMTYFNTTATVGTENEFVGQIVEVGKFKLRIKRLIAEGKYIKINFYEYYVSTVLVMRISERRFSS